MSRLSFPLNPGDISTDMVPSSNGPSRLNFGNSLYSPGTTFRLIMQSDGNAVLQVVNDANLPRGDASNVANVHWVPLWSTGTQEKGHHIDMQLDGNLVVYNEFNQAVWASGTQGNTSAFLRMQDDGNLVIYTQNGVPIWASGTNAAVGERAAAGRVARAAKV